VLWDADFGPAFIKICSYFPYPIKVWVNGHEWAEQQARAHGLGFTALAGGFTHRSLRAQVTALLAAPYTASQMSYDLTRLRRKGLIRRLPCTTPTSPPATEFGSRSSTPSSTTGCWDPCSPPTPHPPLPLREALRVIDRSVDHYVGDARLHAA